MQSNYSLWLMTVPALLVGVIFEVLLGHRHDYTGHYAAGYGATLAVGAFCLRIIPADRYYRVASVGIVPLCLGCILLGAITEATIFRIAKFDEIDFCSQSIGAVLSALSATSLIRHEKPAEFEISCGLIVGICFLGMGGCFAVA